MLSALNSDTINYLSSGDFYTMIKPSEVPRSTEFALENRADRKALELAVKIMPEPITVPDGDEMHEMDWFDGFYASKYKSSDFEGKTPIHPPEYVLNGPSGQVPIMDIPTAHTIMSLHLEMYRASSLRVGYYYFKLIARMPVRQTTLTDSIGFSLSIMDKIVSYISAPPPMKVKDQQMTTPYDVRGIDEEPFFYEPVCMDEETILRSITLPYYGLDEFNEMEVKREYARYDHGRNPTYYPEIYFRFARYIRNHQDMFRSTYEVELSGFNQVTLLSRKRKMCPQCGTDHLGSLRFSE
jgi:hypothetical protein